MFKPYGREDKFVVGLCNFLLNRFASKRYVESAGACSALGLAALEMINNPSQRLEDTAAFADNSGERIFSTPGGQAYLANLERLHPSEAALRALQKARG